MRFAELDVPDEVHEGIRAAGFTTATPIQEAALPVALRGKDVAGQAQTGSAASWIGVAIVKPAARTPSWTSSGTSSSAKRTRQAATVFRRPNMREQMMPAS